MSQIENGGFVKLQRSLLEIPLSINALGLYSYLLMRASYKGGQIAYCTTLKQGQVIVKLTDLEEQFNLGRQVIRTALRSLESNKLIEQNPTNKFTLITVCNYSDFSITQDPPLTIQQPTNNQQITIQQPTNNQLKEKERIEGKEREERIETISPLSPLSKEGVTTPVLKAKKKVAQEDNNHFIQSKTISEELKQYLQETLKEDGYNPPSGYIEKEFKSAMTWKEAKGEPIKVMKLFLRNWFTGEIAKKKRPPEEKTYKTKEEQIAELTPEEKAKWEAIQERKRKQENYED